MTPLLTIKVDVIKDPTLGSASPPLDLSGFLPHDLDRLNQEAVGQNALPKDSKQVADHILHGIKPSQRTH